MEAIWDFGNSVPSAEVFLEQFPDDIFGDAASGGGRDHSPGGIVPAAFDGFAENDGCGALPAAMKKWSAWSSVRRLFAGHRAAGRPCLVGNSRRGTTLNSSVEK